MPASLLRAALACIALTSCTTRYQPMTGLHRPVAIDMGVANFKDTLIELRCLKGQGLEESDVRGLCRKLTRLFENQGARVTARTSFDPAQDDDAIDAEPRPIRRTRLRIELRPKVIHADSVAPFWWDDTSDLTFAQDIDIRDETGFLLVRERLIGRFVRRIGWGGEAEKRFSRDFYGQLSQLAFNARMRWQVAGPVAPPSAPPAAAPSAPGSGAPAAPPSAAPPSAAPPSAAPPLAAPGLGVEPG